MCAIDLHGRQTFSARGRRCDRDDHFLGRSRRRTERGWRVGKGGGLYDLDTFSVKLEGRRN